MAVSSFASAVTGVDTTEKWIRLAASGTDYWLNLQILVGSGNAIAGFYTFKFYADTAATPTGTVKTYDSSFVLGTTTTTLDRDTGSTANYSEMFLSLTDSTPFVTVNSTNSGYLVVQRLPEKAGVFAPITVYSTSQTVTINNASPAVLIGGGAGGGAVGGGNVGVGGGGSGYIQKFTVAPGTYSLVVGAGGTAASGATPPYTYGSGNAGGASTFAGYTANGGSAGAANWSGDVWTATNGGAGGSGGGAQNAAGGANGANGGASTGAGGVGSGVTFVSWYAAGTGGAHQGYGSGGGVYAGGGGGWGNNYNYGVGGAGATGGGGGGTGTGGNGGGAGGKGALIVFGG